MGDAVVCDNRTPTAEAIMSFDHSDIVAANTFEVEAKMEVSMEVCLRDRGISLKAE